MALVTWNEVMESPDYALNAQQIQAALGRQFRAVPKAAPELRQAASQEGARLSKLRELGAAESLANRRLGLQERGLNLQERELNMERNEMRRYARRLPAANLIGLGNVVIGGLSAYGNLAAARRSELRGMQGRAFDTERYQATAQGLQDVRSQQQRMADEWRRLASGYSEP